jgi:hypothetical protein
MPSKDTQFKKGNKSGEKFQKGNRVAVGLKWNHSDISKKKIAFSKEGEKNPAWKGGISPLEARIRRSFKYRQWRSDVFTRDNFTCQEQECGDNKGRNLEAHHIKPFALIMRENTIKTFEEAMNCEELWNINNGITFCKSCHRSSPLTEVW